MTNQLISGEHLYKGRINYFLVKYHLSGRGANKYIIIPEDPIDIQTFKIPFLHFSEIIIDFHYKYICTRLRPRYRSVSA